MKVIKILGTGCTKCLKLENLVKEVSDQQGLTLDIQKVTEIADIMAYGVMSTPGLVVNGNLVVVGRVPSKKEIKEWIV